MENNKRLNPDWKKRIDEIGHNDFELEEMLRLGFYEVDENKQTELDSLIKHREESLSQIKSIETELKHVQAEIQEAQDTEKLLADIRKKRIVQSKIIREQRRQQKLEQKKSKAKIVVNFTKKGADPTLPNIVEEAPPPIKPLALPLPC